MTAATTSDPRGQRGAFIAGRSGWALHGEWSQALLAKPRDPVGSARGRCRDGQPGGPGTRQVSGPLL